MSQSFVGTVKSYNPMKGWGFVESAESTKMYGSDVFLLKSSLGQQYVNKGDQVRFTVVPGPKGVQAEHVEVLSSSGGKGGEGGGGGGGGQMMWGTIQSFAEHKGFGFIGCESVQRQYSKDVFFLKSSVTGGMPTQGAQVQFSLTVGERGPVANQVQVVGGGGGYDSWGQTQQGVSWGQGGWGGGCNPYGNGSWGGGYAAAGGFGGGCGYAAGGCGGCGGSWGTQHPKETQVFYGTLKNVNDEKGWGHIECEALKRIYQKDMFVMKTALDGVTVSVGEQVRFNVVQGSRGPHAINLAPLGEEPGRFFTGSVRSFNVEKGWGFIESEEATSVYGGDVFLHKKDLNDATPSPGDQLQFTVDISAGRAQAKDVLLSGGGSYAPARTNGATSQAPY